MCIKLQFLFNIMTRIVLHGQFEVKRIAFFKYLFQIQDSTMYKYIKRVCITLTFLSHLQILTKIMLCQIHF